MIFLNSFDDQSAVPIFLEPKVDHFLLKSIGNNISVFCNFHSKQKNFLKADVQTALSKHQLDVWQFLETYEYGSNCFIFNAL